MEIARPAWAIGLRAAIQVLAMSQIHGASSANLLQLQYLQSLQSAGGSASPPTPASDPAATAFDPFASLGGGAQPSGGNTPCPPFNPDTMNALISAQEQQSASGTNGLSPHQQKVFSELDTDGDGKVTKAELDGDFGTDNKALSDFVMKKLDINGDGAISQSEFAAGTKPGGGHHHHMHAGAAGQGGQQDALTALMSATQGASSQSASNPDGSSTTTITYADGSKVSMSTPAVPPAAGNPVSGSSAQGQSQANLLEQLIRMQAQLLAPSNSTMTTATLAI